MCFYLFFHNFFLDDLILTFFSVSYPLNVSYYTISGALSIVGNIGFDNVKGLAFDPFGKLWSGSDQGLLQIDIGTGIGTVLDITPASINSLAWNQDGTKLFTTTNNSPNSSTLWVYDTQGWQIACEGLPKKVESLETMPDGFLIYSFHQDTELAIHTFDADTCQTITENIVVTPYNVRVLLGQIGLVNQLNLNYCKLI